MSNKPFIFVANWKMEMSLQQSVDYCRVNKEGFANLNSSLGKQIVLCSTFPALSPIAAIINDTPVMLGAQNCSAYSSGPYTGQVSALSLAQLGCQYCIVGHSESRMHCHETDELVACKARRLLEVGLIPIICTGELDSSPGALSALNVIQKQLLCLQEELPCGGFCGCHVIIAYEPRWAIGTGQVPSYQYLKEVFEGLDGLCRTLLPNGLQCKLLYGAGVNEETITQLYRIEQLSGVLIGGASRDFQKFKNLVSLCS